MTLTKKQNELLEYILEHEEEIKSRFNEELKWEQICELMNWKFNSSDTKGIKRQHSLLATFIEYDNMGTKKGKRFIMKEFNHVFLDEKVRIKKEQTYSLHEDFDEKRHDKKMTLLEAMKYEREMTMKAVEELNDDTGTTTTKLRKAVAKSIMQNLLIEKQCVVQGEFRERWYVTERELLLATGLINESFNPILYNINRFICTLDIDSLQQGKIVVGTLPKELAKIEEQVKKRKITELTFDRYLENYIREQNLTDIAEILTEEIKLQLKWTKDRLDSALKYLWGDLKLIETYDNGHRLEMKVATIVNGVSHDDYITYYPTVEEMDWLNAQYKIVMSQLTYQTKSGATRSYKSWWKICEHGRVQEFYELFIKHINKYSPSKFKWGTVKKIYKCKVLSFVRHQVEYDFKHDFQFTDEEIRALKQIRVIQKQKIKGLVIDHQISLIDKKHENALQGKVQNAKNEERKKVLLKQRQHKHYKSLAVSVVKELHENSKYRYYKCKRDLAEYSYEKAKLV